MFRIEYTTGLTVSITISENPGTGASWVDGDPLIDWGDGTGYSGAVDGQRYSHTYDTYDTYTIKIDGTNDCGEVASYEEDITLVQCPIPTCSFVVD